MSENYFTLMPGEEKLISLEADVALLKNGADILLKQYNQPEQKKLTLSHL
jgi:hypothetical protein